MPTMVSGDPGKPVVPVFLFPTLFPQHKPWCWGLSLRRPGLCPLGRVHSSRHSQRHRRRDWRHSCWPRSRTLPRLPPAPSRLLFPGQVLQCWQLGTALHVEWAWTGSSPNSIRRLILPVESCPQTCPLKLPSHLHLATCANAKPCTIPVPLNYGHAHRKILKIVR